MDMKSNAISPSIYSGKPLFFTLVTEQRRKLFINPTNAPLLRQAFRQVMKKRPFVIDAAVVLPDHIHCIWTLPLNETDFSTRWRLIKTWFTKHYDDKNQFNRNQSRINKCEQAVWQRRYWEHLLHDGLDFEQHVNYRHYNSVKHGYVSP